MAIRIWITEYLQTPFVVVNNNQIELTFIDISQSENDMLENGMELDELEDYDERVKTICVNTEI